MSKKTITNKKFISSVISILYDTTFHLVIKCSNKKCKNIFGLNVPGFVMGKTTCPHCGENYTFTSYEISEVYDKLGAKLTYSQAKKANKKAVEIIKSWYNHKKVKKILTYEGVNLGIPAEYGLMPVLTKVLADIEAGKIK